MTQRCHCQAWVQSLVRELRSRKLHGAAKKIKNNNKENLFKHIKKEYVIFWSLPLASDSLILTLLESRYLGP